jgi:hypothetical protein
MQEVASHNYYYQDFKAAECILLKIKNGEGGMRI